MLEAAGQSTRQAQGRHGPGAVRLAATLATLLLAPPYTLDAASAALDPALQALLQHIPPQDRIPVIVQLADRLNPAAFTAPDKPRRRARMVAGLRAHAGTTQAALRTYLRDQGTGPLRSLWLVNAIALEARPEVIRALERRPDIASVRLDARIQAPTTPTGTAAPAEWNLALINAPALWALGHDGGGVVVANMDTGVDSDHPDLAHRWRGGGNSWFDPNGEHATPVDRSGHGTQTMSLIVGGNADGRFLGAAPGATWIAVKIFDDAGSASLSGIHLGFQWLLDPDGNPDTDDAPDVVSNSWGLEGTTNICNLEFNADIEALRAAGIAVVFAAGNQGPAPQTSISPANNPGAGAVGAVDANAVVAGISSRGASACAADPFPGLVAPGVDVKTADLSYGGLPLYRQVSGTSYAAPHAAGVLALLAGAFPTASVADLMAAVTATAVDLGEPGADASYGRGLIDALGAFNRLAIVPPANQPPIIASNPVTSATEDEPYLYAVAASDAEGGPLAFNLELAPAAAAIDAVGRITWTPGNADVGLHDVIVRVTDVAGLAATQGYTIAVANVNDPPVAADDRFRVVSGRSLVIAAPGVLENDVDPDGDVVATVLDAPPTNGSLSLDPDGGFAYTAATGFSGVDRFSYHLRDPDGAASTAATAIIDVAVNRPPVAWPDWAVTARNTERVIAVLANDRDRDGRLDPASVTLVSPPNRGGAARANPDGSVSYRPRQGFRGFERFRYSVADDLGTPSNPATVVVRVRR